LPFSFFGKKGKLKKSADSNSHYIWKRLGKTLINELTLISAQVGGLGALFVFRLFLSWRKQARTQ